MRVSAGEGIIYFVRAGCGNIFDFPRRSLGRNRVVVIALDLPSRGRHFDYQLTALLLITTLLDKLFTHTHAHAHVPLLPISKQCNSAPVIVRRCSADAK